MRTPIQPRRVSPNWTSCSTTRRAALEGMAKPMPMEPPEREKIAALMLENRTTGFCTYGEQYRGLHMNQTFVGVAFGSSNASGEGGQ